MSDNDKGHFSGTGQCEIHTSRSHRGCKVGGRKPGCNHQKNRETSDHLKKTGHREWVWDNEWNSHHVLCVSCVNKYQILKTHRKHRARIDAVYRKTKWCVNQSANLIALPMRVVYERINHTFDLPCHEWDHNNEDGYADEVTEAIHTEIWQKIAEAADAATACKLADDAIPKDLKDLSDAFRKKLIIRGSRAIGGTRESARGTAAAWAESHKAPENRAKNWWYPFSMAKSTVASESGPMTFAKPTASSLERKRRNEARAAARSR